MTDADAVVLAACLYVAGMAISACGLGVAMATGDLEIDRDLGLLPAYVIALLAVLFWPVAFAIAVEEL